MLVSDSFINHSSLFKQKSKTHMTVNTLVYLLFFPSVFIYPNSG